MTNRVNGVTGHEPRRRRPARWPRRLLLGGVVTPLVVIAFFAALEALLALAGVEPAAVGDDPYVGFSRTPLFVVDDTGARYTTAASKAKWFNDQSFAVDKPDDVTRIFCLGGSTTFGRPYDDRTSFCGWLRALLDTAAPGRFEVINAGGVSYASYRVALVLDEVLTRDADLVIIYTGHNEFLEDRTYGELADVPAWVLSAGSALSHLRTFTAARALFTRSAPETISDEVSTRLDVIGPDDYDRDDAWRTSVLEHLRFNLDRMAGRAADAGVPVVFVTPAGQLRDCTPFASEPDAALPAATLARAADLRARAASLASAPAAVRVEAWRAAVDADPRFALAQYRLGEALFETGKVEAARAAFVAARDEDICPLRAISPVPDLVRAAAERAGAPLVDFVTLVDGRSRAAGGHGIPGRDLFFDHVHPTIEMHWLLGQALFDELVALDVRGPISPLDAPARAAIYQAVQNSIDVRDHVVALRNLAKVLGWAGKRDEAAALAADASALAGGGDAESHFLTGTFALQDGRPADAIAPLEAALAVDPGYAEAAYNLAEALASLGRYAEAIPHFEKSTSLQPDKLSASNNLALMHLRLGDAERALELLDALIARAPDYARAHNNRGTALARLRRYTEAEAALRDAARADPGYAEAHASLGTLLAALGRRAEAVAPLRRAAELRPASAEAQRKLGEALLETGERSAAIAALETATRLDPDDHAAALLLDRARTQR